MAVAAPPCAMRRLHLAAGPSPGGRCHPLVAAPLAQVTAAVGVYKGTAAIVPRGTDVPELPAGRVLAVG